MKQIFFLLLLTGLSLHLAGCFTAVFTMPEGGTKIDPDDLVADVRGNYYHDLSGCSAVEYEGFTITRAGLEPLRAYLRLNTQHYADWRVDPLVWEGAVLNAMVSSTIIPPENFPAERDQNVRQGYCRGKYRQMEGVETFSANPVDLKGIPAV